MKISKKINYGISAILAVLSTVFLPEIAAINADYAYSNSILSLFMVVVLTVIYNKMLLCADRRAKNIAFLAGGIFSVLLCVGKQIVNNGSTNLNQWKTLAAILAEAPLFATLVLFVFLRVVPSVGRNTSAMDEPSNEKRFFFIWALIFAAWVPVLLATWPGIYGYDSIYQISWYDSGKISLHHPLIHTLYLGFCIRTLGGLLGSVERGMAVYSITQMLIMSAFFSATTCYFIRNRLPKIVTAGMLVWFALLPTTALMSISATKDTLYALTFAWMVLNLCKLAKEPCIIKDWKFDVQFATSCLVQMIFRNQGKYIFAVLVPVLLVVLWRERKRMLCIFCGVAVIYATYSGPATRILGGVNAGTEINEMMSVPCVQLSRALLEHEKDLSDEEVELLKDYVPDYEYYRWFPGISDEMKRHFNSERFKSNPVEFVKLYCSVGRKAPESFLNAWARLTIGLWYPDMKYRDDAAWHPYWEYENADIELREQGFTVVERHVPVGFEELNQWLSDFSSNNTYKRVPVVSMLFSSGLPFWLLLLGVGYCFYKRIYRMLIPALAMLLLWLTMMLGPVVLYRYVYPLTISIHIFWAMLLLCNEQYRKDEK